MAQSDTGTAATIEEDIAAAIEAQTTMVTSIDDSIAELAEDQ